MATSISQAWSALENGDYGDAQRSFQQALKGESNQAYAFMGLAGASLAMGNLRDALDYGERALQASETPESKLLLGEIHSRLGNRDEAKQHVRSYLQTAGEHPYARALLGEQQIRTAEWEAGADSYIQALQRDRRGQAEQQFERVVADLSEVVADGRMPADFAEQFLNQVDYNLGNKSQALNQFIARARRALGSRSTVEAGRSLETHPIFQIIESADPSAHSSSSNLSGQGFGGGGSSESQERQRDHRLGPPPASDGPPDDLSEAQSPSPPSENNTSSEDDERGIEAKQKDLASVIRDDRAQNESLQQVLGAMFPPEWPSDPDSGELDPLDSMAWEEQSIFGDSPAMDSTDFRITSGSVRAEIFLERCLQNLLAAAKRERAVSIRYQPETITQLEINCLDGLLDRLPEVSSIYDELYDPERYGQLALGRTLGECLAEPYDGTWTFEEPPEQSRLMIGNDELDPIGLATEWARADDKDDVSLDRLQRRAERAAESSTSLTSRQGYIDPTRELEGKSLRVKLAELWTNYLFRLAEGSFSEVAETIDLHVVEEPAIVFGLHRRFAPDAAAGPNGAALMEGDRVPLAYLRETGEFILPASRKHAARAAGLLYGPPTGDNASDVIEFFDAHHRPDWMVARNSETVDWMQSRTSRNVETPTLTTRQNASVLQFWISDGSQAFRMEFTHAPRQDVSWRLSTE